MLQTMLVPLALYALALFVPGYLVLRCTHLPRPMALCCAPIVTTALVAILGELFAIAHIPATPVTIYLPLVVIPAAVLTPEILRERSRASKPAPTDDTPATSSQRPKRKRRTSRPRHAAILAPTWLMVLVFAVVGLFICNNLFVSELDAWDTVMQHYDVQHHLNVIRSFADARRISSRGVTFFLSEQDAPIMPFGRGSFYPAVWYGQCALLMQATGIAAPTAINVSLAITLGLAYPLATCAFASMIFRRDRWSQLFSALTCVGFAMFPWCLLIFGPLYPNLVGFTLTGSSMALWIMAFEQAFEPGVTPRRRAIAFAIALTALLGQAFIQPNTLFTMFVILVPFVAQLAYRQVVAHGFGRLKAALATAAFLAICLAFWTFCFYSPFFYDVIREFWGRFAYPWQEVVNILTQTYTLFFYSEVNAQILLGILVVIGFVRTAYDRDRRWLCASYLIACYICYVGAVSVDPFWKRFVAGFWYTDAMRLASTAIIVATPLAADGLSWIYQQVCRLLERYNERLERPTHHVLAACVIAGCFVVVNFMPSFNWPGAHSAMSADIDQYRIEQHEWDSHTFTTTFGDYRKLLRKAYDNNRPIDEHERVLLPEVKEIVGNDLVINDPYDGSTLAYGVYGIRTYYRKANGYDGETETAQSKLIRTGLINIASDAEVQAAVREIGAHYVLILDPRSSPWSFLKTRSDVKDGAYDGIAKITEDTPGFTEVLVSGACHLYRIDDELLEQ